MGGTTLPPPPRVSSPPSGSPHAAPERPVPAANYISIDAVSPETVTRKTLLRYMVKSQYVNILLRASLRRRRHRVGRSMFRPSLLGCEFQARSSLLTRLPQKNPQPDAASRRINS